MTGKGGRVWQASQRPVGFGVIRSGRLLFYILTISRAEPRALESLATNALAHARVVATLSLMAERRRQFRATPATTPPALASALLLLPTHEDLLPAPARRADVEEIQGTGSMGSMESASPSPLSSPHGEVFTAGAATGGEKRLAERRVKPIGDLRPSHPDALRPFGAKLELQVVRLTLAGFAVRPYEALDARSNPVAHPSAHLPPSLRHWKSPLARSCSRQASSHVKIIVAVA
jgi:hypothetical protein